MMIKTQQERVIAFIAKRGEIIKKFKVQKTFSRQIYDRQSKTFQALNKHPKLKNSTLTLGYFRNNFRTFNQLRVFGSPCNLSFLL